MVSSPSPRLDATVSLPRCHSGYHCQSTIEDIVATSTDQRLISLLTMENIVIRLAVRRVVLDPPLVVSLPPPPSSASSPHLHERVVFFWPFSVSLSAPPLNVSHLRRHLECQRQHRRSACRCRHHHRACHCRRHLKECRHLIAIHVFPPFRRSHWQGQCRSMVFPVR